MAAVLVEMEVLREATFERGAASFTNSGHVAIVIHNYRWRIGLAPGQSKYDDLEKRLAINLEGWWRSPVASG